MQPTLQVQKGDRTTIQNTTRRPWRVSICSPGKTMVEFDVIVGGSFVITGGGDSLEARIDDEPAEALQIAEPDGVPR